MNLDTLKNTYAQEHGFEDWVELYRRSGYYDEKVFFMHEDAVIVLAEKAALEKAAENTEDLKYIDAGGYRILDTTSITNPENLIQ